MSRASLAPATWATVVETASAPYRSSGRFAWHFARGKLSHDPVFGHLIARGLIAPRSRVLDIGCGQGLLASVVSAAASLASQGRWPSDWAAAPVDVRIAGIEVLARDVARARAALGDGAELLCADMRTADFATADTVVLLDVLHYLSVAEQDAVLVRVRAALDDGGRVVLRIGDASSRRRFAASGWVDRLVTLARGQGFGRHAGRTLASWQARLRELGFAVASEPMQKGTPFANVLLVGTVIGGAAKT
ncbi:MAG: methyltransferase domain-containing protein [Caldimonas sp.]